MKELFGRSPGAAEGTVTEVRALGSPGLGVGIPAPCSFRRSARKAGQRQFFAGRPDPRPTFPWPSARCVGRGLMVGQRPAKRLTYRVVRLECPAPPAGGS